MTPNALKNKKIFAVVGLVVVVAAVVVYKERSVVRGLISSLQKPVVEAVPYVATPSAVTTPTPSTTPTKTTTTPTTQTNTTVNTTAPTPIPAPATPPAVATTPSKYNLAVPFTSQAPNGVWDNVHEETCEETAILMANYYYTGVTTATIDPDQADDDLMKIVSYENATFGYYKDTTAAETAKIVTDYFHLKADLIEDPTVDQIKAFVAAGTPVVVPTAGRLLGNPNFKSPGPLYHMILIKGYTDKGFITNDPGTHNGADYFYTFDVLMTAMHDWNGGDVTNGAKVVIVVKK